VAQPLLFAYVTSEPGFDTEITITNTSRDTLESAPHSGTCTLDFYGSGTVPAQQTTPPIAAGQNLVFQVSAAAPSFTGYLVANCGFPLARGVARWSSAGRLAVAQDAQSLTLPRGGRAPQRLLFSSVSTLPGFDTKIAIVNTGRDDFGTAPTSGACTLSFFGDGAPAAFTTPPVAAGSVYVNLASAIAPNFQGDAIATCDFSAAAGFGLVGDSSFRNIRFAGHAEPLTPPRSLAPQPLLFPALSSQNGQEAEIVIANRAAASGACSLSFFGDNAPAPTATPEIAAGTVYSAPLSAIAPDFQGYMFAHCPFAAASRGPEMVATPRSTAPAHLLFPAVSNQAGLDTNIVISNTSKDSLGSAQASFACTMNYYGEMAGGNPVPAAQLSSAIPPGGQLAFSLSQGNSAQGIAGAPGFRGYVIADCGAMARGASAIAQTTAVPTIVSVADYVAGTPSLAPGSLASVEGYNFGTGAPAVTVGGQAAYVFPGGTNYHLIIQIPVNAPIGQNINVSATAGGVSGTPVTINIQQYAPVIQASNFGVGIATCTRQNSTAVAANNAPNPLETLACYGIGFGPTTPVVPTGTVSPSSPPATTNATTTAHIGLQSAPATFSGLAPGEIGVYQFNFRIPGAASAGNQNMTVDVGGTGSYLVNMPIAALSTAGLYVASTHTGNFTQGQQSATYTLTVSNAVAATATNGSQVAVTETLPTGLTLVSMSGTGWNCSIPVCTRTDALNSGSSYPAITVTVNVSTSAPAQVTNVATVSGGGSASFNGTDTTNISGTAPPPVTTFSPSQGATGVSTTASVTWGAVTGATSYNVYLGTTPSPPLAMSGIAGTSYAPPALAGNTTYYWSVTAVNSFGSTPSAVWFFTTGTPAGYRFVPVTPCRVMDTRTPTATFGGAIAGGTTRAVPVPLSSCNIPSTAQAYSLNITVVPQGSLTYLTIWPTGVTQPLVSTLNSLDGRIVANAAIVPAGATGSISVFVSNTTDVIIDINGYFAPASTSGSMSFYALTPCRIVDTRGATGAFGGPFMNAGSTRNFTIPNSSCNIPNTAQAYSLNMTVVPHAPLSYLTTWPTGQTQPVVSTLNSLDGGIVANAAIVPAGTSGAISVFVTGDTDVIIDINGYFAAPGAAGALSLYTLTPCRVVDTRNPAGPFGGPSLTANGTRSFTVPSSSCSVPTTAQAYSLNVTVVPPGTLTYLTAWPQGQTQPVVSTLNSPAGKIVANAAIVPAGSGGGVSLFGSNATDVILDVNAYFAQ